MNDPLPFWIITLGLLLGGPATFCWCKALTLFESKINLWPWYSFYPPFVEAIFGKKTDMPKSDAIKTINYWNKFMGIAMTVMGILWLIVGLSSI